MLLILISCAQNIFSQTIPKGTSTEYGIEAPAEYKPSNNDNSIDNNVYNTAGIDVKPEFPGGISEFNNFLLKNFIKPADKPKIKGKIYFTFIIEKDGSLSDIKILRDLGNGTGEETIRIIKLAPKWSPGKHKNKEVRTLNGSMITIS